MGLFIRVMWPCLVLPFLFINVTKAQSTPSEILLGQSCALTGATKFLGTRMNAGVMAALKEVNDGPTQGVRGIPLRLRAYDDGYEPGPAEANTKRLIDEDKVFALLGYVGTPTSIPALSVAVNRSVPYIGAFTGANSVGRIPYVPMAVNVRASYDDETAAMADFLLARLLLKRVACFYQDDGFGLAGLNGIKRALKALGMSLVSEGTYPRGTLNIQAGLDNVTKGNPQAIVMIGAYAPIAAFVNASRHDPRMDPRLVHIAVSFVGSEALRDLLKLTPHRFKNLYITQVMPLPHDQSYKVVRNYRQAMLAMNPEETFDFISLEGYVATRFTHDALERTTDLTRSSFLETINTQRFFQVDDLNLGFFGPTCPTDVHISVALTCKCNQGMRQVWVSEVNDATLEFQVVPKSGFRWNMAPDCFAPTSILVVPLTFGLLLPSRERFPKANAIGLSVVNGIKAAFEGVNSRGGIGGVNLGLATQVVDAAVNFNFSTALKDLQSTYTITALVGAVDAPEGLVVNNAEGIASFLPLKLTFTGLGNNRDTDSRELHVGGSVDSEILALTNYISAKHGKGTRTSFIYGASSAPIAGRDESNTQQTSSDSEVSPAKLLRQYFAKSCASSEIVAATSLAVLTDNWGATLRSAERESYAVDVRKIFFVVVVVVT